MPSQSLSPIVNPHMEMNQKRFARKIDKALSNDWKCFHRSDSVLFDCNLLTNGCHCKFNFVERTIMK